MQSFIIKLTIYIVIWPCRDPWTEKISSDGLKKFVKRRTWLDGAGGPWIPGAVQNTDRLIKRLVVCCF